MSEFNIEKAVKAQKELREKHDYPCFAPSNGNCYNCRKNVYSEGGISVEKASRELTTGCPHCNKSFVD